MEKAVKADDAFDPRNQSSEPATGSEAAISSIEPGVFALGEPSNFYDFFNYDDTANGYPENALPFFDVGTEGNLEFDQRRNFSPSLGDNNGVHYTPFAWNLDDDPAVSQITAQGLEYERQETNRPPRAQSPKRNQRSDSPEVLRRQTIQMSPSPAISGDVHSGGYTSFGGLFQNPEHARQYRKDALRFNRKPYQSPDIDDTLHEIASNRSYHVKRIYDAMIRPDAAQDNPGSIAMRRWVHNAYYSSDVVEAFAHKVFDCLLRQAEDGFRGWHHNDYASDERKGSEMEDKNLNCAERLDSIVHSLEREKTICEDVMNSACQIRMFVNAPRAYATRKSANRAGNSKRKKATESQTTVTPRAAKSRRSINRVASRVQAHVEDPPSVVHQADQPPQSGPSSRSTALPYFPSRTHNNPATYYGGFTVGENPMHGTIPTILPPQYQDPTSRFTSVPLTRRSPFLSPPALSHNSTSVPVTPEQIVPTGTLSGSSWVPNNTFGGTLDAPNRDQITGQSFWNLNDIDPALFSTNQDFSRNEQQCHGLPTLSMGSALEGTSKQDPKNYWHNQ